MMSGLDIRKSKFSLGGFLRKRIPSISISKSETKNSEPNHGNDHVHLDEPDVNGNIHEPSDQQNSAQCEAAFGIPGSILDNSNHITVVHSNESMYIENPHYEDHQHEQEQAQQHHTFTPNLSSKDAAASTSSIILKNENLLLPSVTVTSDRERDHQERYTSFTTECISLQNSDMTSHMDEDNISHNNLNFTNYSPIGKRLLDDEAVAPKMSLRGILKNRSEILRVSVPHEDDPNVDNYPYSSKQHIDNTHSDSEPENEDCDATDDNVGGYQNGNLLGGDVIDLDGNSEEENEEEDTESVDITAYLSETESDFDFDPLQEEDISDYKKGGYHVVIKGQIYYSKSHPYREYIILRKLGWGHFSTVWLAKSVFNFKKAARYNFHIESDTNTEENYVAIKFIKSSKHYIEAAEDEISILKTINQPLKYGAHLLPEHKEYFSKFKLNNQNEPIGHPGYKYVMKLLDNFDIIGPNGTHICVVFEVLGENVFNLMCKYKNFYSNISKEFKLKKESLKEKGFSFDTFQTFSFGKKSAFNTGAASTSSTAGTGAGVNGSDATNSTSQNLPLNGSKKSKITKLSLGLITGSSSSSTSSSHENSIPHSPATSVEDHTSALASAYNHEFLISKAKTIQLIDEKIHSLDIKSLNNLIEQLKTHGGLPILLVKQIFQQVFLAIDYIHHCGVIHTDLKPENILIEIKDVIKLIKLIENDKISKHYERKKSGSSNSSSVSTVLQSDVTIPSSRKGSSASNSFSKSRKTSTVSTTSTKGYSRSRIRNVSTSGSFSDGVFQSHFNQSPIRSSKPLPSSITTDIMFKNISYNNDIHSKISESPSVHSPTELNGFNNKVKAEDSLISIKIADLGNGTFAHSHFTDQIQTRHYRSPEIILGYKNWGSSTDMWSIGCMIFELVTGDYLFEPHEGKSYDRDDDHMAQIIELLGEYPTKEYLCQCKYGKVFFRFDSTTNSDVKFKKISQLKYWPLKNVLVEKYRFNKDDPNVNLMADLISKCLRFDPKERIDAGSLSNHPWFASSGSFERLEKNGETKGDDIPGYSSTYALEGDDGQNTDDELDLKSKTEDDSLIKPKRREFEQSKM